MTLFLTSQSTLEKIESRQAVVAVIGLGYVGLPLATLFAESGFQVVGIDVDQSKVEAINRGESFIEDVPSDSLKRLMSLVPPSRKDEALIFDGGSPKRLSATTDFDALYEADVAIVCVPTPLDADKNPDLSYLFSAADEIAQRLHPGMLIVLESTSYPGTTEEIFLRKLEQVNGGEYSVGEDYFLAFSPERIDPGRTDWTLKSTPKVVGGVTPRCLEVACGLYQTAVEQIVPVSSPKVAEMAKLLENTFRATNIALLNEMAMICDRLGVDVWEVVDAAKTKPFGFMSFKPGPGLGGHCIPVDPHYLAWKLRTLDYDSRFIQLALEVNLGMPGFVMGKIANVLRSDGKSLEGSRVLVLGVAYKADVGDLRESPALELIRLLQEKGALVSYHDPYVPQLRTENISMDRAALTAETLQQADCVVITTAHRTYDWEWVVENSQLIVDTRNATAGIATNPDRVSKL